VKREFLSQHRNVRAVGTLLLTLPLVGIALPLPLAQSQPAPTLPAKKSFKPPSAEQKAAVAKAMTIAQGARAAKNVVDFKMENASLDQVIARVKEMLPGQPVSVEVRGAQPVKVSFDLKNTRVGNVLSNVAALAGCRLWVVSSGLLIAPKAQLTQAELADMKAGQAGEWALDLNAVGRDGGERGWSSATVRDRLLARAIGQEVTGGDDPTALPAVKANMTFGEFSPSSQMMLQQIADSAIDDTRVTDPGIAPIRLSSSSLVSIDTSRPGWLHIGLHNGPSDPGPMGAGIGISIR